MSQPNDTPEPSPASAGSHGSPVAYGVFYADGKLHSSWHTKARAEDTAFTMRKFDHAGVYVLPLWLDGPQPTLTDEEREAVRYFAHMQPHSKDMNQRHAATLCGLLDRLN